MLSLTPLLNNIVCCMCRVAERGRNGHRKVIRCGATPLYYQVNNFLDNKYIIDQILCSLQKNTHSFKSQWPRRVT